MRNLRFKENQLIRLVAKDTTPSIALYEAIELCKSSNIEIELNYKGYLFDINSKTTIKEKMRDYNYYLENRNAMLL